MCHRLCRDDSDCGKVLAVIVLPSLPLILCNCWQLISSPAPASCEHRSSTRGSHPGSLHYLWPVVKHTPLLLLPTSSLPPHSQANYQHYHLLFKRDAAQMKRMRAAREAGKLSEWRKGGLEWGRVRIWGMATDWNKAIQWRKVRMKKKVRHRGCFVGQLTITVLCLSFVPPTSFCFPGWRRLYWKWVHPLLIKMNLLQAFTHRTNDHSGQRGRLFSSHHGQHTAGLREEGIFLTFTSAEGKAQLDFPLSTAALTTKHVRNIVVCSFCETMGV